MEWNGLLAKARDEMRGVVVEFFKMDTTRSEERKKGRRFSRRETPFKKTQRKRRVRASCFMD